MAVPAQPKIYHIVHLDNLASIAADGCLWSDAAMAGRSAPTIIGLTRIKQRRLKLPITTCPGLHVGSCVPFYFCSRSIMLFMIHRGNDPELSYRGGQSLVVHLEADLHRAVRWAEENSRRWAFSLSNASAFGMKFRSTLAELDDIDWAAVQTRDWRASDTRQAKQAEFLVELSFPWRLFDRIGVCSKSVAPRVAAALDGNTHRPRVEVQPSWYY